MLDGFRTWLAHLLLPEGARAVSTPAKELPRPKASPAKERTKEPATSEANEAPAVDVAKLEKRARDLEERLSKADEKLRRAEAAKKSAEELAGGAEGRINEALARARRAEAALKKQDSAPRGGGDRRGKGRAIESKLQEAHERAERMEHRAREAERREAEVAERQESIARERDEAVAETKQAKAALAELRSRPAAAPATVEARDVAGRRGAPRSTLDVHFSPGDACLIAICSQLELARETADICVFTITDDRIASAVFDAHRRGVTVRIITDNDKAHDEGSDIRRFQRAGIDVREDQTPFHMHHKFAVFDGRTVLTGSYNWTRGAAQNNQENLIVSDDARLLGPYSREFASLWARLGRG